MALGSTAKAGTISKIVPTLAGPVSVRRVEQCVSAVEDTLREDRLADTFVEAVAAPWFARPATGTPILNLWLRSLGARIGRGVWCETYWLPEADLVRLGDLAAHVRGVDEVLQHIRRCISIVGRVSLAKACITAGVSSVDSS